MADYAMITNAIERQYIVDQLKAGRRSDGRGLNEFRDIKVETNVVGTADGSALVQIGKTKVICGVKLQIGTPYGDSPNKGSLMVGFETSPLSSPEYRHGPPQIESIELARVTDRVIRESGCVDLKDLCIIEGEKVWTLIIDLYSLDAFGNFYDAAPIAAYAALSTTLLPDVEIKEDGTIEKLETGKPLKLNSFPISVTTVKIGDYYVVDPDLDEQKIADARISFGTTESHIVSGQKGGQSGLKSAKLLEILENSIDIAEHIRADVSKQLGLDD